MLMTIHMTSNIFHEQHTQKKLINVPKNQTYFSMGCTLIVNFFIGLLNDSVIINIIPSIKCPRGFNVREKIS